MSGAASSSSPPALGVDDAPGNVGVRTPVDEVPPPVTTEGQVAAGAVVVLEEQTWRESDAEALGGDKGDDGADAIVRRKLRIQEKLKHLAEVHAAKLLVSRFATFSRRELVLLLVREGVEIRHEDLCKTQVLRDLAEKMYHDSPLPPVVPYPLSESNNAMVERGIGSLQRRFVARKAMEREAAVSRQEKEEEDRLLNDEHAIDFSEVGREPDEEEGSARQHSHAKLTRYLDIPWKQPDWNKALQYQNFMKPRQFGKGDNNPKFNVLKTTTGRHCFLGGCGEQCDLWQEGQVSELGLYGAAVTCYFKFCKFLFWLTVILSFVSLPALILNVYGPTAQKTVGLGDLSITTVGNLATASYNTSVYLHVPGCVEGGYYEVNCDMTKERVGLFYAWLDVIMVACMVVGFIWLRVFESREEASLNKYTVSASMFSVIVDSLPPDCDEGDLKKHLKKCMQMRNFPSPQIVQVALGYDNEELIKEATRRGKVLKEKIRLTENHRFECTQLRASSSGTEEAREAKVLELRKAYMAKAVVLTASLKLRERTFARMSEVASKPIYGYVTFDTIADAVNCCKAFQPMTWSEFCCEGLPPFLLFKGKSLHIGRAPEPSTIIWENLKYTQFERFWRRTLTSGVALLLLILSILICFGAKNVQEQVKSVGGTSQCPPNFGSLSTSQQQQFVNTPGNQPYLHCYCSNLSYSERATDSTCRKYYETVSKSEAITFFAACIVLAVNGCLEYAVRFLVKFDKHHSEDTVNRSVFVRTFLLKYINTSGIFLILNNHMILEKVVGISSLNNVEFSAGWFSSIGVTILVVQLLSILTGHSYKAYLTWRYFSNLSRARQNPAVALTQNELNQLHLGPKFEYSESYAQCMATLFTCYTFGLGMPLLFPIGAVNFFVIYFVDKALFFHLYRTPPRLNERLGKEAVQLLPWAIVIHLGTSIWTLGNKELFSSSGTALSTSLADANSAAFGTTYLDSKLTQAHTFILLVAFCIVTAAALASSLASAFENRSSAFNADIPKNSISHHTTFRKAVQRVLIKSEHSYNILLSPRYRDMFSIRWSFALSHSHVRSIRLDTAEQRKLMGALAAASADSAEVDANELETRIRGLTRLNSESRPV